MEYTTLLSLDVRLASGGTYYAGTLVTVLGPMVGDGAVPVRFPGGEQAHVAAWRLTSPPKRAHLWGHDTASCPVCTGRS